MTTDDMTPGQKAAYRLMLRNFERIALRYHQSAEEQLEALREREEMEEMWRLAGFGDPPEFSPMTRPRLTRLAS